MVYTAPAHGQKQTPSDELHIASHSGSYNVDRKKRMIKVHRQILIIEQEPIVSRVREDGEFGDIINFDQEDRQCNVGIDYKKRLLISYHEGEFKWYLLKLIIFQGFLWISYISRKEHGTR